MMLTQAVLGLALSGQATEPSLDPIPLLPGVKTAFLIDANVEGDVLGYSPTPEGNRYWRYLRDEQELQELKTDLSDGSFGGFNVSGVAFTKAFKIGSDGSVVGIMRIEHGKATEQREHGVVWWRDKESPRTLGHTLDGVYVPVKLGDVGQRTLDTHAYGINGKYKVVGDAVFPGPDFQKSGQMVPKAFCYQNQLRENETTTDPITTSILVNDAGQEVAISAGKPIFVIGPVQTTVIDESPAAQYSDPLGWSAHDLSENGIVVGWTPGTKPLPYRFRDGKTERLALLSGSETAIAVQVGESGEVIGTDPSTNATLYWSAEGQCRNVSVEAQAFGLNVSGEGGIWLGRLILHAQTEKDRQDGVSRVYYATVPRPTPK